MLKREFRTTGDGSLTFYLPDWNEHYHSKHGAIQEALHVYIEAGLHYLIKVTKANKVSILEIGFGTGLNAFLTQQFAEKEKIHIQYSSIEAYPLSFFEVEKLNYPARVNASSEIFYKLHQAPWEELFSISPYFTLKKQQQFFSEIKDDEAFQLIYFDAFGARVQPELWTEEIFEKMFQALTYEGILVTYAAKGSARRAMQKVGFTVARLPGPPGKREMVRALKVVSKGKV